MKTKIINYFLSIYYSIKSRIRVIVFGNQKMKQELLLRLALKEKGFNIKKMKIKCDHDLGLNIVNGIKLGIKYPDSFYLKAKKLIPENKPYSFYFNGNMSDSGLRAIMMQPFIKLPNTKVISSDEGRIQRLKDQFNHDYFAEFAKAKFGLCPHQADWPGNKQEMWTYRFIESCFVEAIPVIFKQTPLGDKFINGFYYLWDIEIELSEEKIIPEYKQYLAQKNRVLAKDRFCLTENECKQIRNSK